MMLYNKTWIEHLMAQQTVLKWFRKNVVEKEELANIVSQTKTEYKSTEMLPRIGYGFFTLVISLGALGIFGLMIAAAINESGWFYFLLVAAVFFFVQYRFIKERKYFSNGIDDMLQHLCTYALILSVGWLIFSASEFKSMQFILFSAVAGALFFIAAKYFVDSWLAALGFVCFVVFQFLVMQEIGGVLKNLMPFVFIITSWLVLFFSRKAQQNVSLLLYHTCFNVLQIVSLSMMYAAGNYFVVNECQQLLFSKGGYVPMYFPFKIFFYAYTLITPVILINAGLKNKNSILVRLGIIFLLAGILTIKYYHSIMPIEDALIAAGILLMIISWFIIKKLKPDYKQITSEDTGETENLMPQAEALLILSSFKTPVAKNDDLQFGGGSTGGGGAAGGY